MYSFWQKKTSTWIGIYIMQVVSGAEKYLDSLWEALQNHFLPNLTALDLPNLTALDNDPVFNAPKLLKDLSSQHLCWQKQ